MDLDEKLLAQLSIDPLAVGTKAFPQRYFAQRLFLRIAKRPLRSNKKIATAEQLVRPQIPLSCLTEQDSKLKGFTFYALTGPGVIEDDAIGISILPDKICFAVAIIDPEEVFRVHAGSQEIDTQLFTEWFAHSKHVVDDYFGVTARKFYGGKEDEKKLREGKFLGRSLRTLPAELKAMNPGLVGTAHGLASCVLSLFLSRKPQRCRNGKCSMM